MHWSVLAHQQGVGFNAKLTKLSDYCINLTQFGGVHVFYYIDSYLRGTVIFLPHSWFTLEYRNLLRKRPCKSQ